MQWFVCDVLSLETLDASCLQLALTSFNLVTILLFKSNAVTLLSIALSIAQWRDAVSEAVSSVAVLAGACTLEGEWPMRP